jgi:hypothetical protein
MATNAAGANAPKSAGNFSRTLLATTCLTVACSASAVAGTIFEGVAPAPSDFPNFPNGYALPGGTTLVIGDNSGGDADYFEFFGLGAGTFMLIGEGSGSFFLDVFSDSGSFITEGFFSSSGTIPNDGKLVVGVFAAEEIGGSYAISLATQPAVPEPATFGGVGVALAAGALAWRRKRNQ